LRIKFWKLLTIIGLCCLLSNLPPISCTTLEMSSEGPSFSDFSDFYADFVNENASVWFHVTVTDSDGVDLVIGSTRESSEHLWHNVTMTASESVPNRYYGYYHVVLPIPGGSITFEVKYYAADTLGNWNVSDSVFQYLTNLGMSSPDLIPLLATVTTISMTAVVLIVIIFRIKQK